MPYKDPEKQRRYHLEYERKRRAANPQAYRDASKRWGERNPEKKQQMFQDWATDNKDKISAGIKRRRRDNPEHIRRLEKAQRVRSGDKRRATRRRYGNTKYHSDPQYRLTVLLRTRLTKALRGQVKQGSAIKLLGCPISAARAHIEAQWTVGMSWETHGYKGWHIDHIVPLAAFDLTDPDQLAVACHYTNLQPLWWPDNLEKGDSMPQE